MWSCGDYSSPDLSYHGPNVTADISNEYSIIGDKSIKLTPISSEASGTWLRFVIENFTKQTTIRISADFNLHGGNCDFHLQINKSDSTYTTERITVPDGTTEQKYIEVTTPENVVSLQIQFNFAQITSNPTLFIDNICLKEV